MSKRWRVRFGGRSTVLIGSESMVRAFAKRLAATRGTVTVEEVGAVARRPRAKRARKVARKRRAPKRTRARKRPRSMKRRTSRRVVRRKTSARRRKR